MGRAGQGSPGRDTETSRALVRDTGRWDGHEGEQEPARAGEPKDRLGPGQKAQGSTSPHKMEA